MAALKWLVIIICCLAALGAAGFTGSAAFALRTEDGAKASSVLSLPKVSVRAMPTLFVASAPPTPAPAVAVATTPLEAGVARDAGTPAAAAEPSTNKPPPVQVAPAPGAVAPPVAKPPIPVPALAAKPPAPVPAAPAAAPEAILNLEATDTADVFVDGKRVGSAPAMGLKVKPGPHKVRFDCYDAAGNTVAGAVQNVTATADQPVELSFTCPPSE